MVLVMGVFKNAREYACAAWYERSRHCRPDLVVQIFLNRGRL
jgi:hypothetical protein